MFERFAQLSEIPDLEFKLGLGQKLTDAGPVLSLNVAFQT